MNSDQKAVIARLTLDPDTMDALEAFAAQEARKCLGDMRLGVTNRDDRIAFGAEAQAQVWEALTQTLRSAAYEWHRANLMKGK